MKNLKKAVIAVVVMVACMLIPDCSFVSLAAEGTLMFSDPETKVGEKVGVDLVVETGGEAIGDVEVTVQYDSSALEFADGDGVTSSGDGQVTYRASGNGSDSKVRTTINFKALKEGETSLTVSEYTAYLYSDETLYLTEGSSTVKIAEGDSNQSSETATGSVTDIKVTVDGKEYNFSEAFSLAVIPEGYSETTLTYAGAERKFVVNSEGTIYLGYLSDASGNSQFFLYDPDNATFYPYVEMQISDTTYIVLLSKVEGIELPERYQQALITINGNEFSGWQDMEKDDYYIVYAMNNNGQKSLYQYDTTEGSFQRIEIEAEEETEEETKAEGLVGKLQELADKFFLPVLVAVIALILLMFIIILVLAIKLGHRNEELDDLYDEYGIDEEEEQRTTPKKVSKKTKNQFLEHNDEEDEFENDYIEDDYDADFDEEFLEDDDYEDDDGDDEEDRFEIDFIDL